MAKKPSIITAIEQETGLVTRPSSGLHGRAMELVKRSVVDRNVEAPHVSSLQKDHAAPVSPPLSVAYTENLR